MGFLSKIWSAPGKIRYTGNLFITHSLEMIVQKSNFVNIRGNTKNMKCRRKINNNQTEKTENK